MKLLLLVAALFVSALCEQTQQQQQQNGFFDAAKLKLSTAINILSNPYEDDMVILQAVSDAFDAIFGGNMIVLPSKLSSMEQDNLQFEPLIPEDFQSEKQVNFEKGPKGLNLTISNMNMLLAALNSYMSAKTPSTEQERIATGGGMMEQLSIRAAILEAKDFLLVTKEILLNIARYTMKCSPNMLQDENCKMLLVNDEAGSVLDDVLSKMKSWNSLLYREIRSPFFFLRKSLFDIQERGGREGAYATYQTGALQVGQCSAIVETVVGLKAVFRTATLSMWNFPWLNSSSVIGKKVFVVEWIPAQLIKTISLCHAINQSTQKSEIVQHVNTETVLHRGTLLFWKMFV